MPKKELSGGRLYTADKRYLHDKPRQEVRDKSVCTSVRPAV